MSILKTVGMELIHPNPFRMLDNYPWIEEKLESLKRSIEDVGFWEGVIARPNPKGKGYQIAFGHHRIEAAKRAGLNKADLIVRNLTDEQMIQFMGRENGEDYRADFLTMLNTWEGAKTFEPTGSDRRIAEILGWLFHDKDSVRMNKVAQACAHAHKLISEGHMAREDFVNLSVRSVRDLVARTKENIKRAEAFDAKPAEIKKATEKISKGAKKTASLVREGKVLQKDIKATVNIETRKAAAHFGSKIPLFEDLAKTLCNQLDRILAADAHAEKLKEVLKNMQHIQLESDRQHIDAIRLSLDDLVSRATGFSRRLKQKAEATRGSEANVTQIKALPGGKS